MNTSPLQHWRDSIKGEKGIKGESEKGGNESKGKKGRGVCLCKYNNNVNHW